MNNNDKLLKILELTAKKINPPHKKEVKAIEIEGVKKVDFGTLKPYLKYLRGYEYESDSNIAVWESGISVSGWRQVEPFGGGVIDSIVVLNDKTVAVAREISVEIVDLLSGRCMQRLTHGSAVISIAILNENTIVSGGDDGNIKIWEKQNGGYKDPKILPHGSTVFSIAILNENTIVSGGDDGVLKIWDLSGKANTPKIELYDTEDEGVYQVKTEGRWQTYRTSEEWHYGDDELMYKYGWFTNGNRCVPYYCFDESEIKEYFVDGE